MERMEARGWDAGHDGTSCREGGRLWARLQRVNSGLACWPATGYLRCQPRLPAGGRLAGRCCPAPGPVSFPRTTSSGTRNSPCRRPRPKDTSRTSHEYLPPSGRIACAPHHAARCLCLPSPRERDRSATHHQARAAAKRHVRDPCQHRHNPGHVPISPAPVSTLSTMPYCNMA